MCFCGYDIDTFQEQRLLGNAALTEKKNNLQWLHPTLRACAAANVVYRKYVSP